MPKILHTDFSGGMNRFISRTNLKENQFYTLDNVRIDKELGKLIRRGGLATAILNETSKTIRKIINYFESDDTEKSLVLENATTGWRVYDWGATTQMIADTGIARGTHEPYVIIHNDVARIYLGNLGGTEPLLTALWFGKVDRKFFNNIASGTASDFDDYYLSSTHLLNYAYNDNKAIAGLPSTWFYNNDTLIISALTGTSGDIFNPVYRMTYMLDGFQETTFVRAEQSGTDTSEGDIIFATPEWEATNKFSAITVEVGIKKSLYSNTDVGNSVGTEFNKRISGINVYRTADTSSTAEATWSGGQNRPEPDSDASWYLIKSIDIDDDTVGGWADGVAAGDWVYAFSDTITDTLLTAEQLYDTRIGHDSACDFMDISYAVHHKQRIWAIKTFQRTAFGTTGTSAQDRLYFSTAQVTSAGTNYALDSFGVTAFINIGKDDQIRSGATTGIVEWGDRLLIFKENTRYRVYVAPTIANTFVEETIHKGCYAPRSLLRTRYGIFFLDRDTVWLYNGVQDYDVGLSIRPLIDDYAASDIRGAFAVFNDTLNEYLLFIDNGSNYKHCFALPMNLYQVGQKLPAWQRYKFSVSTDNVRDAHFIPQNGMTLAIYNTTKSYLSRYSESATNDAGNDITVTIEGARYLPEFDKDILFKSMAIRHNGSEKLMYFYNNETLIADVRSTNDYLTYSALTTANTVNQNLPQKIQGEAVDWKITGSAANAAFEIDEIGFDIDTVERRV